MKSRKFANVLNMLVLLAATFVSGTTFAFAAPADVLALLDANIDDVMIVGWGGGNWIVGNCDWFQVGQACLVVLFNGALIVSKQ